MKPPILLTGATGYIGGRLLKLLEAEKHSIRCLTRRRKSLQGRVASNTEVMEGDVLEFEVTEEDGGSRIRQTAIFDPVGLWGLVYWYTVYPTHELVFAGMLRGIARAAEKSGPDKKPQ
ncbi:MAG: DUF2867 domain-containing protein [Acidobacteria bacterium]|nr:DUF2867 domain-containing protein [Acidobacteriota bacterium]